MRDFIRKLSGLGGATLQSIWTLAIVLIPFAGLIWLGIRRPWAAGSVEIWRALTATALVLALWRVFSACIPFFERVAVLIWALPLSNGFPPRSVLSTASGFWLAFALFVAILPRLWSRLALQDVPAAPPAGGRRSPIRRFGSGLRWTYVAALCLVYLALARRFFPPEALMHQPFGLSSYTVVELLLTACFCLVLLGFGLRAFVLGAGVALVSVWRLANSPEIETGPLQGLSVLKSLAQQPRWLVVLIAVLAACPFLFLLVRRLTGSFSAGEAERS